MGLTEVQGALARLYVDPILRDRFYADPASVGLELGLGAKEARGLACVSRRQVEEFAASLRRKRRDQARRVVPMAARALGRRFDELFERYAVEAAPRGSKADLDDAAAFVATLHRWGDRVEPPWAADLAWYELAGRQAARAGWLPVFRVFRFPVARLARGEATDEPRATLALWWRPARWGRVRHLTLALSWPGLTRR